jgi:hypothetical protein
MDRRTFLKSVVGAAVSVSPLAACLMENTDFKAPLKPIIIRDKEAPGYWSIPNWVNMQKETQND